MDPSAASALRCIRKGLRKRSSPPREREHVQAVRVPLLSSNHKKYWRASQKEKVATGYCLETGKRCLCKVKGATLERLKSGMRRRITGTAAVLRPHKRRLRVSRRGRVLGVSAPCQQRTAKEPA